jgi:hypothetical protein
MMYQRPRAFWLLLIMLTVLAATPALATPILLPVNPAFIGQPTSANVFFPTTALNGTTLAGQPFSLDLLFADDILARLRIDQVVFAGLVVQTTAEAFPGFAGPGPTGFLLLPDGTPLTDPIGAGRAASSDGRFIVGFDQSLFHGNETSHIDIAGAHLQLQFPDTGYSVTGAQFLLQVADPAKIHFGTAAQLNVPEPATWLLLGSGLAGLVAWRSRQRKTGTA